jgi:hypothetical protein
MVHMLHYGCILETRLISSVKGTLVVSIHQLMPEYLFKVPMDLTRHLFYINSGLRSRFQHVILSPLNVHTLVSLRTGSTVANETFSSRL